MKTRNRSSSTVFLLQRKHPLDCIHRQEIVAFTTLSPWTDAYTKLPERFQLESASRTRPSWRCPVSTMLCLPSHSLGGLAQEESSPRARSRQLWLKYHVTRESLRRGGGPETRCKLGSIYSSDRSFGPRALGDRRARGREHPLRLPRV